MQQAMLCLLLVGNAKTSVIKPVNSLQKTTLFKLKSIDQKNKGSENLQIDH